jgi:uncharacterized oligopeptide transporter (OPT) family protein
MFSVVALIGFSVCCAAAILAGIYPSRPSSLAGWLVLMSFGVPFYLATEYLGDHLLSNRVTARLGRTGQIFYGVLALGAVATLAAIGVAALQPYFGTWAS